MDPITFSIIRHRLFRIVDEAVITLKHVSGSAITNEGHDLMVSLYRADGSLLMGGVGFLHHLTSAAEACKAIIRRFEGQINEGDVYLLNDPYTAALLAASVLALACAPGPEPVAVRVVLVIEVAQTELIDAVRQVAGGSNYINPELGVRLARESEDEGPPDGLSRREAEILGLVALGHTNQEIAERLFLSPRTIEAHRGHIRQKLRFQTQAELVRYAFEHGLIESGQPGISDGSSGQG